MSTNNFNNMQNFKLFALLLIPALLLTGCISKRPLAIEEGDKEFSAENSQVVTDPNNRFSITVPSGFVLAVAEADESAGAVLYGIAKAGDPSADMYIEENGGTVDGTVSMFVNLEQVSEQSREDVVINGFEGKKVNVILPFDEQVIVPYYFIRAGSKTYVFSLNSGQPFEYFNSVLESLSLVD